MLYVGYCKEFYLARDFFYPLFMAITNTISGKMADRKESESDMIFAAPRLSLSDPEEPKPTSQIPSNCDEKSTTSKCAKEAVKEKSVNKSDDQAESNLQVALR